MKTVRRPSAIAGAISAWCLVVGAGVAQAELVEFRDYDAATGTFTNAVRECTLVTSATRTLATGWYAVKGTVTIPAGSRLDVQGAAHLILCDGAKLSVEKPGEGLSAVKTTGAILVIYGQGAGSGQLVATGGGEDKYLHCGTGIGGDPRGAGGMVTINGGTVKATDTMATTGAGGAGIGGGFDGVGGAITINGGTVTATSSHGAGIGGGCGREGGTITINGGVVTAKGGYEAAGIGGGSGGAGGTITINGGTVTAKGGYDATGIGGGRSGKGGTVTISAGAVDASGMQGDMRISGGIFANEPQAGWLVSNYAVFENPDEKTRNAYPYAVMGVDIPYFDWDENLRMMTNAVVRAGHWTEVTADTHTLTGGVWYVVRGNVVLSNGNLTVQDSPHLILCDGSTLTIESPAKMAAVSLVRGMSLSIYGQLEGSGCLTAMGGELSAGIGGSEGGKVAKVGSLTVNGGMVKAQGGNCGAGIGGGDKVAGGMLTVNGGTVIATGGAKAAGIGGGCEGSGGSMTINGGTVTARGGEYGLTSGGAGIGGGAFAAGGTVTINGGTVTAKGGYDAAGIGGGKSSAGGTVTIADGAINASSMQGDIQISGGIFNISISDDWCAPHFIASGNPDPETRSAYPYKIVPAWTVTIGTHPRTTAVWTSGDGSVTNTLKGSFFRVPYGTENVTVHFTALPDYVLVVESTVDIGKVTKDIVFGEGKEYEEPRAYCKLGDIPYLDWNGSKMVDAVLSRYDYALVTSETKEMEKGWYVVAQDVECATIKVTGAVNLVVADGCELKAEGGGLDDLSKARIEVSEGNSLVVYGQTGGTGKVTAISHNYGAGIGGGYYDACGTVTINGCVVTTSGNLGAGIGGGHCGAGGTIRINGGTVTASTYASTSAAIGSADGRKDSGLVTIGGGAIKAGGRIWGLVTVSGGIFDNEPEDGWLAPDCVKMENQDEATKAVFPWKVVSESCTVTVGNFPRGIVAWTSGDGLLTNVIEGAGFKVKQGTENVKVIFTAKPGYELVGETVVNIGTVTADIAFGSGSDYKLPSVRTLPVEYVDEDGVVRVKAFGEFTKVTSSTKKLEKGKWYAVIDDVTLTDSLPVEGTAQLILCDWATLAITNSSADAALSVGDGASLTIYGQTANTGRLEVRGGNAGIGGKMSGVCGAVTIHGGAISASAMSSKYSAGIGSGGLGIGGSVTITGGRITAKGGDGAEDIGSGANAKSPCLVSISGGIFARELKDAWCADHFAAFANPDPVTKADYPYAVLPACTLTIGECPKRVSAAWMSGNGTVTNAIEGASTAVPRDASVRVVFSADDGYALYGDAVVDLGTVTDDITFGVGNDYKVPHAYPAGAVSYLDWDAENETLTNATVAAGEWTLVTAETRTLDDGWYVVAYDVVLPVESNIVVNGSARLILCDGASLSVTGGYDQAAIEVSRTDAVTNSLAIYGQAECTGRLTAQGGYQAAAIGTGFTGDFGAVTINGGTVTATGGWSASAIGNGWWGQGGTVTINAGRVMAVGGMGRGNCAVSIRSGIFGMTIPDAWCADHHGAFFNLDPATRAEFPYAVLPAWKVTIGDRPRMTVGWTSDDGLMTNAVEGTSFMVRRGERNVRVIFTADSGYVLVGDPVVHVGTVNSDIVFGVGNDFKAPHAGVPYLDWDETNHVMTNAVSPAVWDEYHESMRELQDGHWYVVSGEHLINTWSALRVSGDVHLILCDESSLSIIVNMDPRAFEDQLNEPGIEVGEESSLTVYGQVNGSGRLSATGGYGGAAGIGGRPGSGCGAVTINGGEVSAQGDEIYCSGAAGIGGGNNGSGGRVTINGGIVTARGGEYGAGIGTGDGGRNMTVILNGGTVVADGGYMGAGIGCGKVTGEGNSVTINDGAVSAAGGWGAEDIGHGYESETAVAISVSGGIYWAKPRDEWLTTARSAVPNMDSDTAETYPWRVVESETVVTPGSPLGPYETAAAATNAMATSVFAASTNVATVLTTGAARGRYAGWFNRAVTSKAVNEWYVEAVLSDAAKTRLAETATKATRQIPVAEIAALAEGTKDVPVDGCEPGFYYTLYGGQGLTALPETGTAYRAEPCDTEGKVTFGAVEKPSDAAGFFTIGVSATKGE